MMHIYILKKFCKDALPKAIPNIGLRERNMNDFEFLFQILAVGYKSVERGQRHLGQSCFWCFWRIQGTHGMCVVRS